MAAAPLPGQTTEFTLGGGAADPLSLRVWSAHDGLPQNSVNEILQTDDGFIWLATFGGLARFDGVGFETIDLASERGLAENRILSLHEVGGGELLIGYEHRGMGRMGPDGRITPVDLGTREATAVWEIAEDEQGNVWVAASEGLARRGRGADVFEWVFQGGSVRTLAITRDGVRVVPSGGVLRHFSHGGEALDSTPLPALRSPSGGMAHVRDLLVRDDGTLVVAAATGLFELDLDEPGGIRSLDPRPYWSVLLRPTGEVWAGSEGDVFTRDGEAVVRGPNGFWVYSTLEDREGNVWFGTRGGGLLQLRRRPIRVYPLPESVPIREIAAVAAVDERDGSRSVWAASTCRGLWRLEGDSLAPQPFAPEAMARQLCPTELLAGDEGLLLVRYGQSALHLATGGPAVPLPDATPLLHLTTGPDGGFRALTAEAYYRLHLAPSDGSGVLRPRWEPVHATPESVGEVTGRPLEDPSGTVWIPQGDGLLRLGPGGGRLLTTEHGLPPGEVRALYHDPQGGLWVGTYGGGLARLKEGEARRMTRENGLADNFISAIVPGVPPTPEEAVGTPGPDGSVPTLWFLGNKAVFSVSADELAAWIGGEREWVHALPLDAEEGFSEPAGPAAARSRDGELWIGSLAGLMHMDLRDRPRNTVPPNPAVLRVVIDDRTLEARPVRIPSDAQRIEIEFTAPSFRQPDDLRFRYRLRGPDEIGWSRPSGTRRAVFTDLTPGAYHFEMEAYNEEGVVSAAPASLTFKVEAHLWETRGFRLLAFIVLLGCVYGIVEWRANTERRRTARLQREIDERKRVEAERDAVEARLRRAARLEAVGQLTGGVAHDFNNLLTVVMGNLALARDEVKGTATGASVVPVLDRAQAAAERGARVTSQLLAFARRQQLRTEQVRIDRLVTHMRDLIDQALGETINLELDVPDELWACRADAGQLESALLNLVLNARDAMPEGGHLRISLGHRTVTEAETAFGGETAHPGDYVHMTVADTGVGIPDHELEAIFQPFYTTKEVGKGTGLGLSMVYGLVVQCGGFIEVETAVGEGTAIRLFLPRDDADVPSDSPPRGDVRRETGTTAEGAAPAADTEMPRGRGEEILVIEDNEAVRTVAVRMLRGLGYTTLEAASAAAGLVTLGQNPQVALVLSDVVMPGGMSGRALRDRLAVERPDLPVVLMSGYLPDSDAGPGSHDDSGDEAALIRKPFTRAEIARAVRRHLDRA